MIIDELFEGPQLCPECGGISFSDLILAEKKDACYYKVKASAKVWPSAYASGRLVQCRKKGAANYGNKNESVAEGSLDEVSQDTARSYAQKAQASQKDLINQTHRKGADIDKLNKKIQNRQQGLNRAHTDKRYYKDEQGVAEGTSNIGSAIKSLYQKIYNAGDDEIEYFYHNSPIFAQYWDEYEGDINSIIAEVDPGELQVMLDELESYAQQAGLAEDQLDEKWSQKYKSSINCANPKGFSQRAHCAGRKKNEDVEESLGKQIHSTFQSMGDSFSDAHLAKGISYFLQGRYQEGENWLRGKIPQAAQDTVFGKLRTLQAQGGVDVNKNANVQQYIDDKLVPWVKNQIQQNVKEGEQQKGADYRDPKEVDYDDEYDAMVARVKKLAGLGPMRTVYDPNKRVYRNMPTAQQPKK
jgi:hypothetical protein